MSKLSALWCEEHPDDLRCVECKLLLGPDALVRTLRVVNSDAVATTPNLSRVYDSISKKIMVFDRHLRCMKNVNFVTISHVWDPEVSDVQNHGHSTNAVTDEKIALKVVSSAKSIYESLEEETGFSVEMWYDYLSVPQWHDPLKMKILSLIPKIFQHSRFTLVVMEDVTAKVLARLRDGKSLEERVSGITGVCNAKWFSRVWTMMEFVRANHLRVMIHGHQIQPDVKDVFIQEIRQAWKTSIREVGNVHILEKDYAKLGENIVPWNLGKPEEARMIIKEGKRLDLGMAFSLLCRRGCRSQKDFFYALLGLIGPEFSELPSDNLEEASRIVQKACLASGDMSPLLMTPGDGPGADSTSVKRQGYFDAATFNLGPRTEDPLCPVQFESVSERPRLTLSKIGEVFWTERAPRQGPNLEGFWMHIYHALNLIGPIVEEFVKALGGRWFHLPESILEAILHDEERRNKLAKLLTTCYNLGLKGHERPPPELTTEIGNLMYILQTPPWVGANVLPQIHHVYALGGTVHGDMRHQGWLIAAQCPTCRRNFVYRAAIYNQRSEAFGAIAYRIPGLRYSKYTTSPEGVGILVKEGRIVGRLLWATPACACPPVIETVTVSLNMFAMPL
ncbi:hypothetical protein RB213_011330 [Colletotrichum asianum]